MIKEKIENQVYNQETESQKKERFLQGVVSREEFKKNQERPEAPLFEHEIIKKTKEGETPIKFRVFAMSDNFTEELFREVKDSWEGEDVSFPDLKEEIDSYLEQEKLDHPTLYTAEYYVITDDENKPFALTGIFTTDIQDAAGLGTRNLLDPEKHHMVVRLGWYAVSKKYQNSGVGGFILNWTEKLAKARGGTLIASETSDWVSEDRARRKYENAGYKQSFNVKDYFGPGRDLFSYFSNISNQQIEPFIPTEEIAVENKEEILKLAEKIYSPDRMEEFRVCLDLFLQQKKGEPVIFEPHSFVLRDKQGNIENFCIASIGVYENILWVNWDGVNPDSPESVDRLAEAIKGYGKNIDVEVMLVHREGEAERYQKNGFQSGENGVGPDVYLKSKDGGDESMFLFYTKKL
ncbi:MAG: GNAT family N-acetyltransferase [Candidatus Portnoybacteria bacterium]|nr:GNAT family N-acetyltransferase [Candidatus Portnoybacteria bacterium]MDD4982447.1 GNAT family N-acetyltransferase [Candidatus Portnoybacteria bacterium]